MLYDSFPCEALSKQLCSLKAFPNSYGRARCVGFGFRILIAPSFLEDTEGGPHRSLTNLFSFQKQKREASADAGALAHNIWHVFSLSSLSLPRTARPRRGGRHHRPLPALTTERLFLPHRQLGVRPDRPLLVRFAERVPVNQGGKSNPPRRRKIHDFPDGQCIHLHVGGERHDGARVQSANSPYGSR